MNSIAVLDTSLKSENDGDRIIVDAVEREFSETRNAPRIATHKRMGWKERRRADKSDALLVTGTNILSSDMFNLRQWPLHQRDVGSMVGKVVFCGVGWWQYQGSITKETSIALSSIKHRGVCIAARDQYTVDKLKSIDIKAINTGCPTMWRLPASLPALGSESECVFTLTNYNPSTQDSGILKHLLTRYERVLIWPQSRQDEVKLKRTALPERTVVLRRGLNSLEEAARGRDYVGTRLHAGVRCAQVGSAIAILAVDNRALEIGRDTGLPVVPRNSAIMDLNRALEQYESPSELIIPHESISAWKTEVRLALGLS